VGTPAQTADAGTNELVVGEGDSGNSQSAGETVLLQNASISGIDPNIRQTVDQETADSESSSQTLLDTLVFWRKPEPYGTVVDPTLEQKRLQENAALGKPANEGEVPVIVRRKRGILEGLF
jgi:hypothetical protein